MKPLPQSFFNREADIVARELIGKTLVRIMEDGSKLRIPITETEAYMGPHDNASHSSRGRTERTEVMYGEAGRMYVYLIYGMYWMLNFITGEVDYPAGVLLRGAGEWNGPGKVTRALGIDKSLKGKKLSREAGVWIEDAPHVPDKDILITPRIGINYATPEWRDAPLRFVLRKR